MSLHELRMGEEDELQLKMSKIGAFSMNLKDGGDEGSGEEGSDLSLDLPDSFDEDMPESMGAPPPQAPAPSPKKSPAGRRAASSSSSSDNNKEVSALMQMLASRDFGEFCLSQSNLNKLRKRRETDLSLRELVCLRAAEVAVPIDLEKEMLEKKYDAEITSRKSLQAALAVRDKEIARMNETERSVEHVEEGFKREIAVLMERCARLTEVVGEQQEADATLKVQAGKAVAAEQENERLRNDLDKMRIAFDKQTAALSGLTESEKAARTARADAEKARELLLLDKSFLAKELREATAKANDYGRRNEELSARTLKLDAKVSELTEQLLAVQLKTRSDADARLEEEVRRLREEAAATAEGLRAAAGAQADRETRVLRETKDSLSSELEHARRNLVRVTKENADNLREHLGAMSDKEGELTECRGELKIRTFEAASMRARAEEADSRSRQLQAEVDLLREQIGLHQATVHRLEAESAMTEQTLKSDLERALERVRAYEALEETVDREVVRAAAGADGDGDPSPVLRTVQGLPVNPERRIRQAVQLAAQLARVRGDLEKSQNRVIELERERDAAREEAEAQKRALSRVSAPQTYLVGKLAEEEGLRTALGKDFKALQGEVGDCRAALRESEEECEALRQQLASMVSQRGEVEQLRGYLDLLGQQQQQQQEDEDGAPEIEEEDDEGEGDDDTYGEEVYEEDDHDGGPAMDASRLAARTHDEDGDYTAAFEEDVSGFPATASATAAMGAGAGASASGMEQRSVSFMDLPPELRERMTTLDTSGGGGVAGGDTSVADASTSQMSGSKSPGWHKRVVLE